MASTYSDLKIELIGTGDQSGTWGSTTNSNLGNDVLGAAIAGSADVTFSSADVTVTLTDTVAAQTARNLRLNLTGTTGGARNLILGSGCQIEKPYLINNGTADTITVKNTTGTGIAVPAGKSMWVYNNGTNVVDAVTHLTSLTLGSALPIASGGTGSTSTTFVNLATNVTGDLPFSNLAQGSALSVLGVTGNATADVASIAAGTDNQVLRRSGTSVAFGAVNLASTDAVTGDLPFSNLAQGSALSVLGVTGNATADVASIAAGTDNQVLRRSGTAVAFGAVNLASTDAVTGTLPVGSGGTGTTTLTGIVKGNAGSAFTAAVSGTDIKTVNCTSLLGPGNVPVGSVTSVATSGTVSGITLTGGPITSSGTITLGGTLSGVNLSPGPTQQVTGTLPVGNGGTGATTLTGLIKGNGGSAFTAAVSGTDIKTVNSTSLLGPGNVPVGSVTSVATSGTINCVTLTGGPITSSGTITLGGGVNVSTITTGTLPVARGGTGLCVVGTSGNVLTSNGTAWVSQAAGGGSNTQTFSASGTYTKPPTANFVYVELWGAGGGGTGAYTGVPMSVGRGGGGGGYTHRLFTAPQVGATETVTIGAGGSGGATNNCGPVPATNGGNGGNTTFGSLLTAGGGGGGRNPTTPANNAGVAGRGGVSYGFSFNSCATCANRNIYQSFGGYQVPTPCPGPTVSSMFGVPSNNPAGAAGGYFGVYAGGSGANFNGNNSGGISWFGGGGGAVFTNCFTEGGAGRLFGRSSVPGTFTPNSSGTGGNATVPAGNFDGATKNPPNGIGQAGGLAGGGSAGRVNPAQVGGAGGNGYAVIVSW